MAFSYLLLKVLIRQGWETKVVLGMPLSSWLSYPFSAFLFLFIGGFVLLMWILGVDLINFHRLHHLPMERYDSLLDKEGPG